MDRVPSGDAILLLAISTYLHVLFISNKIDYFNTHSALFGGGKKAKKPKNLGKILKMVPSESQNKANLDFQKNSLKVRFFIYLRPSEKIIHVLKTRAIQIRSYRLYILK